MSGRQIVGAAMMAAPLVAIFVFFSSVLGVLPTISVFVGSVVVVVWWLVATRLLESGE